jgi:hypothetical protein
MKPVICSSRATRTPIRSNNFSLKEGEALHGIRLLFGLLCDDVRLEMGGKISIIGESNHFMLPQIPMAVPICILTKWAGPPGSTADVCLQMLSPDSMAPIKMCEQHLELSRTDFDTSFGGTVNKLVWQFQTTGVYTVQVLLDGEEAGRIELMVKKGRPPQMTGNGETN